MRILNTQLHDNLQIIICYFHCMFYCETTQLDCFIIQHIQYVQMFELSMLWN